MGRPLNLCIVLCVIICYFQVQGGSKYTDENRPYEFGFTIEGEQHRHEKKDENGIIMGEFGFITADGVYHVTVYATDENGNFKILSMKNIRVKPYPTSPTIGARQGHSLSLPSSKQSSSTQDVSSGQEVKQKINTGPVKSCSHCGVPTTTTISPRVSSGESLLTNNKVDENRNLNQKPSSTKYGSYEQNSGQNYSPQSSFGNNGLTQITKTGQNNGNQITETGNRYPENIKKPALGLDTPLTSNYLQNYNKQQGNNQKTGINADNSQVTDFKPSNSQSSGTIKSDGHNDPQTFENYPQDPYTEQKYSQGSHSQGSASPGSSSEQVYPQMPLINADVSSGQGYKGESGSKSEYPYQGEKNSGSTVGLSSGSTNENINSDGFNEISESGNPEHKYNSGISSYPQTNENYPQNAGKINSQGTTSLGSSTGQSYPREPPSYQQGLISGRVSPGDPILNFKNDSPYNNGDLQNGQGAEVSQAGNYGNRQPKNFDEILQSINPEKEYNTDGPKSISSSQSNIGGLPKKPVLVAAQMQIVDKNTDIYHKKPGEEDGLPNGLTNDDMKQLLYTFNYTVGFHGHHEEGYTNGAKYGYYYVTGRNGIRTRVDYVADEKGFHPKISQEVLDIMSDEVPKPETEKDEKYGLKGYEFKWLYYPVESP